MGGERRRIGIDFDDRCPRLGGGEGERCGRMDDRRGPDDEHDVAGADHGESALDDGPVEHLPEPDDVGAEEGAAMGATRRDLAEGDVAIIGDRMFRRAADFPNVAVEFQDVRRAGEGMEAVHVLGDEGELREGFFPGGQGRVAGIGGASGDQAAPPVIPFPDELRVAGEGFGRGQVLGPEPAPQPLLPAEGGDAGFGRDPGAGKRRDPLGAPQYFRRLIDERGVHMDLQPFGPTGCGQPFVGRTKNDCRPAVCRRSFRPRRTERP